MLLLCKDLKIILSLSGVSLPSTFYLKERTVAGKVLEKWKTISTQKVPSCDSFNVEHPTVSWVILDESLPLMSSSNFCFMWHLQCCCEKACNICCTKATPKFFCFFVLNSLAESSRPRSLELGILSPLKEHFRENNEHFCKVWSWKKFESTIGLRSCLLFICYSLVYFVLSMLLFDSDTN